MKILLINGSPRKDGNTYTLIQEAASGAKEIGAKTEILQLRDLEIKPCIGCLTCFEKGECAIKNDDMHIAYEKLLEADGIIFGTPVYGWGPTSQMKLLLDRIDALIPGLKLKHKVGGVIIVSARRGNSAVATIFLNLFVYFKMIPLDPIFAYAGFEKEKPLKDKYGLMCCRETGRLMAQIIKDGSKIKYPPEHEENSYFVYMSIKYNLPICPTAY